MIIDGKLIKLNTLKLDKIDNSTAQSLLFGPNIMLGLTDSPSIDTDIANKKYVDDTVNNATSTNQYTDNVTIINATGTDTYIGIGIPTITAYDINTLYIVTFTNGNTSTTPTLNIDGVGAITIVKTDDTGRIPLDAGDIVPSVQYFLTYNGSEFQMYLSNPTPDTGRYTNLNPVPAVLGGVPVGTIFNNVTIGSVFDMLLYPYLVANFTAFAMTGQSTLIEVGASIASGNKTFTWTTTNPAYINTNSISISKTTGGTITYASGLSNTGSTIINFASAVTRTVPTTYNYQIKAQRTNMSYFTRDFLVTWAYKIFNGTSTNTTITSADALLMTGNIRTNAVTTYTFAGGGYKYFVIPNNLANPTLFRDVSTNLSVGMADSTDGYTDTNGGIYSFKFLSITNTFGITQTYRVYRSKYILGGAINIAII